MLKKSYSVVNEDEINSVSILFILISDQTVASHQSATSSQGRLRGVANAPVEVPLSPVKSFRKEGDSGRVVVEL